MDIKRNFPDHDRMDGFLHDHIAEYVSAAKGTVGHLEEEYILAKKKAARGWTIITISIIAIYASFIIIDPDSGIDINGLNGWIGLFVFIFCGTLIFKTWKDISGTGQIIYHFNSELNKFLWPLIFKMFGLEAKLIPASILWQAAASPQESFTTATYDITGVLAKSELITEAFNRSAVDDVVQTSIGDNTLRFAELDIRHVTGSGKNRRVRKIFRGYFVEFDLDTTLNGKTFISTEGDKRGFGHQSFWKNISGTADVQPTTLEWNDFEELLHVATNNPTEARYVLSPSFMNDLYDWWQDKKVNIRVSFIGDKMYMLFPDNNIQMKKTVDRLREDQLLRYLQKIAPSIMFILHLIEDVQLQFNR